MTPPSGPTPSPVDCMAVREAVSALLDGEDPGPTGTLAGDHLAACEGCRDWEAAVARVHRRVRVADAPAVPDLRARILQAVPTPRSPRRREARMVLVLAGLVQVVVAVVSLVGATPLHAVREVAAFEVALGLALVVAAWRPGRFARGMVPLVTLAAVVVLGAAVVDVAEGVARPVAEFSHLVPAIGAAVLWRLGHQPGPTRVRREWA